MQRTVSSGPRFSALPSVQRITDQLNGTALPRAASFHDAKLRDKAAANYLAHKRSERRTAAICATILAAFYASACLLLALGGLITQYGSPSVGLFLALSGLALLAMLTFGPRNPK